jgi:hypothetical protein
MVTVPSPSPGPACARGLRGGPVPRGYRLDHLVTTSARVASAPGRAEAGMRRGCGVPALALSWLSKVPKIERRDLMAGRVEVLAAGQAPGAARRLAAVAADPEPGRVAPAADAQLEGVRQQAGDGHHAPPGAGGRGCGPFLAGRHARARCRLLDEPSGGAVADGPTDQVGLVAAGLACACLTRARRAGPAGQCTADAAHGDLLVGWAGRRQAVAADSTVGGGSAVHHT